MDKITQKDIYIRMPPSKRLEIATGLFDFAFEHLTAYFRHKYPRYNDEKILELVKERILNNSSAVKNPLYCLLAEKRHTPLRQNL